MRLSEAIRLGAMIRPQAFGVLFDPDTGGTCANGAAMDAIGALDTRPVLPLAAGNYRVKERAPIEWVDVVVRAAACPACARQDITQTLIIHLNNDHRWTREQIADWIEQQETIEGLKRADAGVSQVCAAMSPAPGSVDGGDRAPESSSSALVSV